MKSPPSAVEPLLPAAGCGAAGPDPAGGLVALFDEDELLLLSPFWPGCPGGGGLKGGSPMPPDRGGGGGPCIGRGWSMFGPPGGGGGPPGPMGKPMGPGGKKPSGGGGKLG